MINNTTGSKIKELRNKLNLTQQQLADMVGVSNKAVSKWESGDGLPDIENLKRVSRIFNVSIDELLSNEIKKENDSELNKVLIIIAGLTVLLYFLPFMKMNPFDNSEFTFISLSGIKLLMESFINFKLGNILIGVSLILILVNAYFQVYDFYKNQINSKQRVFSLISLVSSFIILLIIFLISQEKTFYTEMTLIPVILVLSQITQFALSEIILKLNNKQKTHKN